MNNQFFYPEFDKENKKQLSSYGEDNDMMMDIAVYDMKKGEKKTFVSDNEETAVLLIKGEFSVSYSEGDERIVCEGERHDFINEGPFCLHACKGVEITVEAIEDSEVLVQKTLNDRIFKTIFYTPSMCTNDTFGKGSCENRMERTVRTIFDYSNAPYSNMVNGEVINHQGSFSSYTPHSHPQPEVYYYRYERPEGFGACFIGDNAYKIKDGSVAHITPGETHPQCSAPGFPMYYCWMIRHLDGNPWTTRDDDPRYLWIKEL